MSGVLAALLSVGKWLITTTEGQTLALAVLGLLGIKKKVGSDRLKKLLELGQEVFWIVESWAKKQPGKVTSDLKLTTARGHLRALAETRKWNVSSSDMKALEALWAHLGWAEKNQKVEP